MISFYDVFMYTLEKRGIKKARGILIPETRGYLEIGSACNLNRYYESSLLNSEFSLIYSKRFMNTVFVYGEAEQKTP